MADFLNPNFADPNAQATPGEADEWTWDSTSVCGEWAEFNTAVAVLAWNIARESFEAGYGLASSREYADEAARLGAVGLTASDIGSVARQNDDKSLWVLQNNSPLIWTTIGYNNEDFLSTLVTGAIAAAVYNGASSSVNAAVEDFSIWGESWWVTVGSPWFESGLALARQDSDSGLAAIHDLGFRGWYSSALASNEQLIGIESFSEAWGNDPFSSSLVQWSPGTTIDGVIKGEAITFPLEIPIYGNTFFVWHGTTDALYRITIPDGEYATATSLASNIQGQWAAQVSGSGLEWAAWADANGDTGLSFGRASGAVANESAMLGAHEDEMEADARSLIGFSTLGFSSDNTRGVVMSCDYVSTRPTDVALVDRIILDRWSFIDFMFALDAILDHRILEYSQVGALFNAFSNGPDTMFETYYLEDWFGTGAAWNSEFTSGELTGAIFTDESSTAPVAMTGTIENFIDPTVNWDENIFEE